MYSKKTPAQEPDVKGPGVSELLKTTREKAGEDLETVCQVLRIRLVYLQAIEDGRYEDLPGKTYVVGFVRAYAEHLGLDVEEVVNRFKHEVDGLEAKADLVFPSPATEQSVPGGAIILIGLILAAGVYGGWYLLSSQDRDMAELVPDLPAKFAELVKDEPAPPTDQSEPAATPEAPALEAETAAQTPPEVSEEDAREMAAKALQAVDNAAAETAETPEVETVRLEAEERGSESNSSSEEAATAAAVEEAEESLVESVASVIERVEEQVQAVIEPEEQGEDSPQSTAQQEEAAAETPEPETNTVSEVDSTEETASETDSVAVEEDAETEASAPVQVSSSEETETSEVAALPTEEADSAPVVTTLSETILLKAVDYSWIQIVESDGRVVHTQALNQGEEYEAPKTAGLILRTGNAGGLEIFVDDEKVPSIGGFGEVRRRVLMDPSLLKSGEAVER